jgi:hypothetical protein
VNADAPLATAAALAAFAWSAHAFAQSAAQQDTVDDLLKQIETIQLRESTSSPELLEPLASLSLLYEENDEPVLATAVIKQALQIVRINEGLYSLEQAPWIRRMIANAETLGDAQTAWDLEQELLTLAERHPDDIRTARIFRDTGDRRSDVLRRYNAGEFPPEIAIGCYYGNSYLLSPDSLRFNPSGLTEEACGTSGSQRVVRQRLGAEAKTYYVRALDIVIRNEHAGDELQSLLRDLIRSCYRSGDATLGQVTYTYLLAAQATISAPWPDRIDTLVQMADWELFYSTGRSAADSALARYSEAYALSKEKGVAQTTIDAMFSPDIPITLPTFTQNRLAAWALPGTMGHVDVGFEIDEYGKARNVRIHDATDQTTRTLERDLEQSILRARFRPRAIGDRFTDRAPVVVRYYLRN